MLFADKELWSKYDFENIITSQDASFHAVAVDIEEHVRKMLEIIDKKEHISLFHKDNAGKSVRINHSKINIDKPVWNRSVVEIEQILHRDDNASQTTIEKYLLNWNIVKNESGDGTYFQMVYFVYIMQYFIFPDEKIFTLLNKKHMSTDISPLKNASRGKYLYFMLENFMDNKEAANRLVHRDKEITLQIHNISKVLNKLISKEFFDQLQERTKIVEEIIVQELIGTQTENQMRAIDQATDYIDSYQNLAYISEMINNLSSDKRPFDFPEIDLELDINWRNINLVENDIDAFLKKKDVIDFYTQGKKEKEDIVFEISSFIHNTIEYDKELYREYDECIFLYKDENSNYVITGETVAILSRTYIDLLKEKYNMKIKGNKKWISTQFFRNVLGYNTPDIVMRYLIIAFQSEYLNVTMGHGYYPVLFKPIYLNNYLLTQKIMRKAFLINNPEERVNFLFRIQVEITKEIMLK